MANDSPKGFISYGEYEEQVLMLTDEEAGQLYKALYAYSKRGEELELTGMAKMLFSVLKMKIDHDTDKYKEKVERNKENGAKGGRPRKQTDNSELTENRMDISENPKNPTVFSENPKKAKKANLNLNLNLNLNNKDTISNEIVVKEPPKIVPNVYQQVVDMYNSICVSLPKVKTISDGRIRAIKARLAKHDMNELETVFHNAEMSDFLSGRNGRWSSCSFDWLMKENNMLKVLEGNYANKGSPQGNSNGKGESFGDYLWSEGNLGERYGK